MDIIHLWRNGDHIDWFVGTHHQCDLFLDAYAKFHGANVGKPVPAPWETETRTEITMPDHHLVAIAYRRPSNEIEREAFAQKCGKIAAFI